MSGRSRLPLRVGAWSDTLASADDKFWPHENSPGVKFNLPLQIGATGGHGTGPYTVSSYTLNQRVPGSSPGAPTMAGKQGSPGIAGHFCLGMRRVVRQRTGNRDQTIGLVRKSCAEDCAATTLPVLSPAGVTNVEAR
jgi:hypothetical protein